MRKSLRVEHSASRFHDLAMPTSHDWQHEMVEGRGRTALGLLAAAARGPLPVLDLPTDFARPAVQSYEGAAKHFYLDPKLTRGIVALGESLGVSLYTTLLAAFQVFLGR